MAYVLAPKVEVKKAGRPARKKEVVDNSDPILRMANDLKIDLSVRGVPLSWKLKPDQVYRYGRIWEQVADRWCPTPVVPDSGQWIDSPKVVHPQFMAGCDPRKQDPTSEQSEYIERERKRIWQTGVWIRRGENGLAWVPPWQYGVLNYWQMNLATPDGMKEYRDKDRRKWLHFATGFRHPKCAGINYLKRRRDGASIDGGFCCFWFAARKKVQRCGIMSFDEESAGNMFTEMVREPFYELPVWLMPIHSTTNSSPWISLTSPPERKTAKNYVLRRDESMKGWIKFTATTQKGWDGRKMAYTHVTEAGKIKKISIRTWHNINKLTVVEGPVKVGFMQYETTCDELRSGGEEFRKIFKAGKQLNERGETENDLWSIFMPAYEGYQGFVDEDGEDIIENPTDKQWAWMQKQGHTERIGAKQYQQMRRDKLKDNPEDLMEYIRKEPWTEEEAFDSANTECHFNLDTLVRLKDSILEAGEETLWRRGNFEWLDREKTVVRWVDDSVNGRFQCSWFPPSEFLANRVTKGRNGWEPQNKKLGIIGLDPFNNAVVSDKRRGSKGGMTGRLYFDYPTELANWKYKQATGRDKPDYWPTPSVFLRYVSRPPSMQMFYEDVLKCCWYYGMPLANERQINKIEMYMSQKDCMGFMLTAAEMKGFADVTADDYRLFGLPMSDNLSWECIELINGFLNGDQLHLRECQYKIWEDVRRMPFLDGVEDLMAFRNDNRTVADWVMSLMQAVKAEEGLTDMKNPFLRIDRDYSDIFRQAEKGMEQEEEDWKRWQVIPKYRGLA